MSRFVKISSCKYYWRKFLLVFFITFLYKIPISLAQVPSVDSTFDKESILDVMVNIIDWISAFLGLLSVIVFLYAGYLFMTGGSNEKRLQQAKGALKWAIVGVVVAMFAFGAVRFVGIFLTV
jgi:hypothetical protein